MEILVTIQEVGAYSERQYQRQDGTTEYFKSRGFTLKRGGDTIYGELTGEAASKNRDTQYYQNQPYIAKGFWKQRTWGDNNDRHENIFYITDIQPCSRCSHSKRILTFSGASLHKGSVLGASQETDYSLAHQCPQGYSCSRRSLKDGGRSRPAVMAQQLRISEIRPETEELEEENFP